MGFSLPELVHKHLGPFYVVVGVAAAVFIIAVLSRGPNLDAIPTVGSRSWLSSWWGGLKFLTSGIDLIQEGYEKYGTAPFKVADLLHWTVFLSSREHIEELLSAPEETLSFAEGTANRLHHKHIFGNEINENPYHLTAIRTMTRNIGTLYPEIRDEIVTAFDELLDLRGNKWKSVSTLSLIQNVVCRTSNRLFVGLPLCRNPDWIDLNIQYTLEVGKAGFLLGLFPEFMRTCAVSLFRGVARGTKRGRKHIDPMIEERLRELDEYGGEEIKKRNDILSWLMEEARGAKKHSLALRMLAVNITAIHTSSNSFTLALYFLAGNPQYIQPLREEVERTVEAEGWTKAAVNKMRKVDSFLRECQRLEGIEAMSIFRKALKDYTFKDGTFIPKGTFIGVPSRSLHYEGKFYENPKTFQPFRFVEMHAEEEGGAKGLFVSTTMEYLVFGRGRHACPGRFFAAHELKSMLAHIVVTYDVKLEDNATHVRSRRFGTSIQPNPEIKVMFRKRSE